MDETLEKLQFCYDEEVSFKIETLFDSGIYISISKYVKLDDGSIHPDREEIYSGYSFEDGINALVNKIKALRGSKENGNND